LRDSWECIKNTLLSESMRSCLLVLARDCWAASIFVDEVCRLFSAKDLDADTLLRHSVKVCMMFASYSNQQEVPRNV
jgi:hypothetical protein